MRWGFSRWTPTSSLQVNIHGRSYVASDLGEGHDLLTWSHCQNQLNTEEKAGYVCNPAEGVEDSSEVICLLLTSVAFQASIFCCYHVILFQFYYFLGLGLCYCLICSNLLSHLGGGGGV